MGKGELPDYYGKAALPVGYRGKNSRSWSS